MESEKRAHEVVRWRQIKQLEEKRDSDSDIIRARQEEHYLQYRTQLDEKRKIGRYKTRPVGPRKKEIIYDPTPTVHVIIKGKFWHFLKICHCDLN